MNNESIYRCGLEITGTERGEWQGVLRTGGEEKPFRSVLELLCMIQSEAGPPMPDWETK